jgi:hypothetical protein
LPDKEYELPILEALSKRGGRAPAREIIDDLESQIGHRLTEVDREKIDSGETRWRNRAQFVRLKLVAAGDMVRGSPRGLWEISEKGKRRVSNSGAARD